MVAKSASCIYQKICYTTSRTPGPSVHRRACYSLPGPHAPRGDASPDAPRQVGHAPRAANPQPFRTEHKKPKAVAARRQNSVRATPDPATDSRIIPHLRKFDPGETAE